MASVVRCSIVLALVVTLAFASHPNSPGHCVGTDTGHVEADGKTLNCGTCIGADKEIDCGWRKLVLDLAVNKLGDFVARDVHDALQLSHLCGYNNKIAAKNTKKLSNIVFNADAIYVDASSSLGDGSEKTPFNTLEQARDEARARNRTQGHQQQIIITGSFHLSSRLDLDERDSGLEWMSHPDIASPAVISGSVPLKGLAWAPVKKNSGLPEGVFVATLGDDVATVPDSGFRSLYVGSERYWPARWPNNPDPMRNLYPVGYSFNATWGADLESADGHSFVGGKTVDFCTPSSPPIAGVKCSRPDTAFPNSPWKIDGWACRFSPCVASADPGDHSFSVHGQIDIPRVRSKSWSKATLSVAGISALHDGSWGNWGFNVNSKNGSLLGFRNGGFQEQTGSGWDTNTDDNIRGGKRVNGFFMEMVLEELDAPGEFFYSPLDRKLYVFLNKTTAAAVGAGPGSIQIDAKAVVAERLVSMVGTQQAPVMNISFTGITFEHSTPTFLGGETAPRFQASCSRDCCVRWCCNGYIQSLSLRCLLAPEACNCAP